MSPEKRKRVGNFAYSLGSYPVQDYPQDEGYTVQVAADESEFGPRFEYEVMVSTDRLIEVVVRLTALLPDEIYFILESYPRCSVTRRVYLTDSTRSRKEFTGCLRRYARLWKDEGFVSFGAFSYDPPVEIFLNEHKSVMIYTPFAESTEEILQVLGLGRLEVLESYYMNVEHVHSSVAQVDPDGETLLLREQVEEELFTTFDFYDQTPGLCEAGGECCQQDALVSHDDELAEEEVPSWRCHVHGRLVVVREGRRRDFHQVFCVAAADEVLAADWVRDALKQSNARMVRVQEMEFVEPSELDPVVRPEQPPPEGVWYESQRLFLGDLS